ncbi:acyltransferase [Desulfosporosinus fructosivorans]|uniref:Acyltransferase n=1 Tax=Desulfosporosinus fructosivorans TaxID=2018669 RepID=A0A4Z0RDC1_9FIRM|nr:acyltransferase family protein [Desulfosporosinus fructosivorans]TGE39556.1 acyltransferase [Desulfosporosinus fructosivorans]
MINKQSTEQLKGIAIILVVLGHLFVTKFIDSSNHTFNYFGAEGVGIFLILSGYGLTTSFLKNGMDKSFLVRRIRAVMLPYALVTTLWLMLDYFKGKMYSLKTIVLSLVGFDLQLTMDATMWYITFILMWYLIYYLIFSLKLPNILSVGLLFGAAYLFRYHSQMNFTEQVYWQWGLHSFMFPLGALFALFRQPGFSEKIVNVGLGLFGLLGFWVYNINVINNDLGLGPYMVSNFSFSVAILSLMIIIERCGLYSRLLRFIGSISFEIYLFEAVFMYRLGIPYILPNKFLSLGLYLIILIGSSLLLKKLIALLLKGFTLSLHTNRKSGPGQNLSGS